MQLGRRAAAPVAPMATILDKTPATHYKLFVGGAQRGPYALDEVAQQLARGEIDGATRIWNMDWNPRSDKWKTVAEMPELAAVRDDGIPDPDDGVPDPE
jgi:hypothetical protein